MAARFIQAGHIVCGCARSPGAVQEWSARHAPPHRFEVCDVSRPEEVEQFARRVLADDPAVDLLVNNAAVINANAPLWNVSVRDFSDVIDVNVKGTFHVIRSFAPAMIARGKGVIVNMSSGWGRSTSADVAPYCATKWAIEGLTQALAEELPAGMAAVALNPGIIDTDMLRSCFGPAARSYPNAESWAERAVPFLLRLGPKDNGASLSVPG